MTVDKIKSELVNWGTVVGPCSGHVMTLSRNLRLTFTTGAVPLHKELAGSGTALPVSSIDGVGDAHASALGEGGIQLPR